MRALLMTTPRQHHGLMPYPRTVAWIAIVLVVFILANLTPLSAIVAVAILLVAGVIILLTKGSHR